MWIPLIWIFVALFYIQGLFYVTALNVNITGHTHIEPGVPYRLSCFVSEFKNDRITNFTISTVSQIQTVIIRYDPSLGCYYEESGYKLCTEDRCSCDTDGLATHWIYDTPSDLSSAITFRCSTANESGIIFNSINALMPTLHVPCLAGKAVQGSFVVNITESVCLNFNITHLSTNTISINKDGSVIIVSIYYNETDHTVIEGNYTDRITCYRINRQTGTLQFCLINTAKKDAGTYYTTAIGTLAKLIVLDKPTTATTFLNETGTVGGVNALLLCSSSSTSVPSGFEITYTWKVNNTIISSNAKYNIQGEKDEYLNISVDRSERFNAYSCAGKEKHGLSSEWSATRFVDPKTIYVSSIQIKPNRWKTTEKYMYGFMYEKSWQTVVSMKDTPDKTPIIIQSPPGPIISGNKVALTCFVSGGNPLVVLSWNCTGNYNNDTSGNTASYSVDFTVDKNDNNKICTCTGIHIVPSYISTIHHRLVIFYAPESKPTIQQIPEGVIVPGSKVTLTCRVSGGNPPPVLTWDCNGTITNSTSGNTASSSIEFVADVTFNNKICNCTATHPLASYRPSVQQNLAVYCSPHTSNKQIEDERGLFTAGISSLVVGLFALIIAIVFISCWRFRVMKKSKSQNHYTDVSAKTSTEMAAYDAINQSTNIDTNKLPTEHQYMGVYSEECQPHSSTSQDPENIIPEAKGSSPKEEEYDYVG